MKVILPLRNEFGLVLLWQVPAVHAMRGDKIVMCEGGMEALYPSAVGYLPVARRHDDERRGASYSNDDEFLGACRELALRAVPGADIAVPYRDWPKERFVPDPVVRYGIKADVVVCPRKRKYGSSKNWAHWDALVEILEGYGLNVFAAGAPDSSCDVPCRSAWHYERFLDASIEAMQSARLVVATDAGLAHLAVLCGRPLKIITHGDGLIAPGPVVDADGRVMEPAYWPVRLKDYYLDANHQNAPIELIRNAWYSPNVVAAEVIHFLSRTP